MAKYNYLITTNNGDPNLDAWVKDGHFDVLAKGDNPGKYDGSRFSLAKAKHHLFESILRSPDYTWVILKFDGKPPYKYHGVV
ncbi:hypothetical protein D3C71_2086470 [compost metagenome]